MKSINNIEIDYPNENEVNTSIHQMYQEMIQQKIHYHSFKYKRIIYLFILLISLLFILESFSLIQLSSKQQIIWKNDYVITYESTNVFIGQIEKYEGTAQYFGIGTPIPYTYYEVKVIDNLKGNTNSESHIIYYGGRNLFGIPINREDSPKQPTVGAVYLFLSSPIKEAHDYRKKVGYFPISTFMDMRLLDNYDITKDSLDQNESINQSIVNIKDAINHPITLYLFRFLVEHGLNNVKNPEMINFQNDTLDLRLYEIDNHYYLYYFNHSNNDFSLHYSDTTLSLLYNTECIQELIVDPTSPNIPIYINSLQIGTINN